MRLLLLLFITIPIVEMWVLIEVGARIGALSTIFLVFLTAAIGLALLRQQGLSTLLRVNQRVEQGQLPAGEILEGVMLAVGGALLLTPGFITDGIGFACLLPFTRRWLVTVLLQRGLIQAASGQAGFRPSYHSKHSGQHNRRTGVGVGAGHDGGDVLDGEFKRED